MTPRLPKPIIGAVNGPALAGGFEIVLSCDLVVAADTSRFGIPEVSARPPGRGRRSDPAAQAGAARDRARARDDGRPDRRRPRARARARQPRRARDQVVAEACALAERIGENSPIGRAASRQLVREAAELSEADGWKRTNELAGRRLRERRRGGGRDRLRREAQAGLEEQVGPPGPDPLCGRVAADSDRGSDHS